VVEKLNQLQRKQKNQNTLVKSVKNLNKGNRVKTINDILSKILIKSLDETSLSRVWKHATRR